MRLLSEGPIYPGNKSNEQRDNNEEREEHVEEEEEEEELEDDEEFASSYAYDYCVSDEERWCYVPSVITNNNIIITIEFIKCRLL